MTLALHGRHVMVVEDEVLVALHIEGMLEELGCTLAATFASFEQALSCADTIEADVAVLDINVAGEEIFPVAERLRLRGVPLVFSTGYDHSALPALWRRCPVVHKPYETQELGRALCQALQEAAASSDDAGVAG